MKSLVEKGLVFIYPTDTIYGIGCDATNYKAVQRIRKLKKRDTKPFSVIAPSKKWIAKNFIINKNARKWLNKLPGPYTLILNLKKQCVAKNVNLGKKTLGVRIPGNWSATMAKESGKPVVTTSVNISGKPFMTSADDISEYIKKKVDIIVYEGKMKNKPSTVVDLTKEKPVILR